MLDSCNVQNLDSQVNAIVSAHMKEYRNKWQTTDGQPQLGHQYGIGNSFSGSKI